MVKKRCIFKNLEEILKNLEEILKTWKKFRKHGKHFQKAYDHPDFYTLVNFIVILLVV